MVDDLDLNIKQRSLREISSSEIGEMVLEQLKEMSEVAFIRFASVHRQFRGISDFVAALETINRRKEQLASVK